MAASTTGVVLSLSLGDSKSAADCARCRRRITPTAGRALEKLGHAIEYLADEYVNRTESLRTDDPEVQAVQILMALNREIYFECPVVPTFAERLRSLFRLRRG